MIALYERASEGTGTSVQEIFRKSLQFIEHLKKQLLAGTTEEKEEAIRMMRELHERMKNHTKMVCENSGISEEQLIADAENPSNFTPEQWRKMQDSRKKLADAGKDLIQLLKVQKAAIEERKKLPSQKKRKKPKKSHWIRS